MKKIILAIFIILILVSCNNTEENKIKNIVINYIDEIPAEIVANNIPEDDLGINYVSSIFAFLQREILNIQINNNSAIVTVRIKNVNLGSAYLLAMMRADNLIMDPNQDKKVIRSRFVLEEFSSAEYMDELVCKIHLIKNNNNWNISYVDNDNFVFTIVGNLHVGIYQYYN